MVGKIELTDSERELAEKIVFDRDKYYSLECKDVILNGELSFILMQSLREREAIPIPRWKYFIDPTYNVSNRKRSKMEIFRQTEGSEQKMYCHGAFAMKYLRYFIFGANLPDVVKDEFLAHSQEFLISSEDLLKLARTQVRREGLKGRFEEFYQLALDCGRPQWEAASVREAVMKIKW